MLRRTLPILASTAAIIGFSAAPALAKSCNIDGKQQSLGATYVTTLSAKGTSCRKAEKVVKAYNDCRGSSKKCKRKVLGFKCRTKVLASSPLQYDAKATCKKGGSKVKFNYTQNT